MNCLVSITPCNAFWGKHFDRLKSKTLQFKVLLMFRLSILVKNRKECLEGFCMYVVLSHHDVTATFSSCMCVSY